MIAGVDGAPGGWVAVICGDHLENPEGRFVSRLSELPRELRVVAVDIPIGLPDSGSREADVLARKALRPHRGSSVFPCPIRTVLGSKTWEEACARSQKANDGKKISRQVFGILPKIDEVDHLVRTDDRARRTVYEVHPELSFMKWQGRPMSHGKKKPAGREERRRLIDPTFGPDVFRRVEESLRGHRVGTDDLADAFAAVWTAARIAAGTAERFPEDDRLDSEGVPMRI